jgi:integrase
VDLSVRSATFADVPLSRLRRSHLETWVKAMDGQGLAPGTIRTLLVNVRSVLRAAVRDRIIASDPSVGLSAPRDRQRAARMTLPTPGQVAALTEATDDRYRALVALAAFAGLRLGEAGGAQIRDVDFLRRQLRVERQVQRAPGGEVEVRAPKYASERIVHLADDLVAILSRHVAAYRSEAGPTDWLFEASTGQPPHQNTIGHAWRSACKRAGIHGVTLHDLKALLRERADRCRLRCGHRSAGARACQSHHHPQYLRAPLAYGRGSDPSSGQ